MTATKTIVVSGVNMTNSGVLSVLKDCLTFMAPYAKTNNIRVIALVHDKELIGVDGIEYIEFPLSKKSWLMRLYLEYFQFNKLSKQLKPDIWWSLHDLSAHVQAKKKFVYFHNPSPFFAPTLKDWWFGPRICLFAKTYHWLYRYNLESNDNLIVQQHWLKEEVRRRFGFDRALVAHPQVKIPTNVEPQPLAKDKIHFFYPAFPRMFKNFEVICKAVEQLPDNVRKKIRVHLTLDKSLNNYARHIVKKYGHLQEIEFTGLLPRETVWRYYQSADVLLFPSRLETWGLPMTEFRSTGKPIFAADLPYAKETLGGYVNAYFFSPSDPEKLAQLIKNKMNDTLPKAEPTPMPKPDFENWDQLFDYIFKD